MNDAVKLTTHMRDALHQAQRNPLRRTHTPGPGKPPWPAAAVTLHALVHHGLLIVAELRNRHGWPVTTWTITDAGKAALTTDVKAPRDIPRFLSRPSRNTGDYTTNPTRAIDDLEVVDAPAEWTRWSGALHDATQQHADDVTLGEATPEGRLRALREMARNRGIDIRDDLRVLNEIEAKRQRRLDAIERKVRREAA